MKTYSHSYHYGKRISWRAIVISLTIAGCAYASHLGQVNQMKLAEDIKVLEFPKVTVNVEEIKSNSIIQDCKNNGESFVNDECTYSREQMEAKVKQYFPRSWKQIMVIVQAEGGWSMEKKNYNCFYPGYWEKYKRDDGHIGYRPHVTSWVPVEDQVEGILSTSCAKKDVKMAWSVDCFLLQKNYIGRKECPSDVTIDEHLKQIADMSKKVELKTLFSSVWTNNYLTYK